MVPTSESTATCGLSAALSVTVKLPVRVHGAALIKIAHRNFQSDGRAPQGDGMPSVALLEKERRFGVSRYPDAGGLYLSIRLKFSISSLGPFLMDVPNRDAPRPGKEVNRAIGAFHGTTVHGKNIVATLEVHP
jgi:hypothetical protein